MRLLYHPDRKDISLAGVLYALGDPVRLEIVKRLSTSGELPCCALDCAIADNTSISPKPIAKSTMSHHFKILRESGVVYSRKEGTQLINSLRRSDLDALFPGLLNAVLQSACEDPVCMQT
ncbi:ArsR/SmtB family transcription factor [Pseudanabaena sp. PCC 6802]|uniref:ArsR/SmtB family transcription factor n=1 Tax=Pseudanabaena sp. PCC 6802 TaxID=118173 RepID=UPI00034D80AD|nr:metalloregulator ArsR/SmtB family transcription factor [Pseudanabaena sp. PCC 6802]